MEPAVLSTAPLRTALGAQTRPGRAATLGLLLTLLCFLPRPESPGAETRADGPDFWSDLPRQELVDKLVEEMGDDELLVQVFMLGYIGVRPSADILRWIGTRNLGGVKVFSRNVSTLSELAESIQSMQAAASEGPLRIPLLVSTDQEGGWIRHIKGETSVTPGNIALGATGLPQDALLTGYYIGLELRTLGVNMNFAPTIDVYTNPSATVIGPRAFSSDPVSTALLALAYYQGLSRTGVIATAKHFPGHGQADKDSHGALPVVDLTLEELWSRELVPYRVLISEGVRPS
jgi:beta-N-acetylhexosaminidase